MDDLVSLVELSKAGNTVAYQQLVKRFQNMAYGYACSVLGDAHLAEDATQEAFIETFGRLSSLQHPQAFPGWLRRIIFKHCDRMTRGKHPQAVAYVDAEPTSLDWEPSRMAERRELTRHVHKAIQRLPETYREISTLFYLEGCSQKDISAFLDIPQTTIKTRLQQARRNLRDAWFSVAEEALRENYLPSDFAAHVLAGLMTSPKILEIAGHPVQQVWQEVLKASPQFEVVRLDEWQQLTGDYSASGEERNFNERKDNSPKIAQGIWKQVRGRTPPVRIIAIGRHFRNWPDGKLQHRVVHQIEAVCLASQFTQQQSRQHIEALLTRAIGNCEVRWQPISSPTANSTFRIAVKRPPQVLSVGTVEFIADNTQVSRGRTADSATGFVFEFEAEKIAMLRHRFTDIRELWGPKYCPIADNFGGLTESDDDPGESLKFRNSGRAVIEGIIPGAGQVTPGQTWVSADGVLHIRGQKISENRIEGGWDGAECIDFNLDLDQQRGIGLVRNHTVLCVRMPQWGLAGEFAGTFVGSMRNGGVRGQGVFHGDGQFAGMKAVIQAQTADVCEPFEYQALIIEPFNPP